MTLNRVSITATGRTKMTRTPWMTWPTPSSKGPVACPSFPSSPLAILVCNVWLLVYHTFPTNKRLLSQIPSLSIT